MMGDWCDNVDDAVKLRNELRTMLFSAGFVLRKWSSNNDNVLSMIPDADLEVSAPLNLHYESSVSALGLQWYPACDCFGLKVMVDENLGAVTKRSILSTVARLFDPLGFLTPTIILAKILLQRLWALGLEWDQEVPPAVKELWSEYLSSLSELATIRVPRWLSTRRGRAYQIHAFCDASEMAYGAVLYIR